MLVNSLNVRVSLIEKRGRHKSLVTSHWEENGIRNLENPDRSEAGYEQIHGVVMMVRPSGKVGRIQILNFKF